MANRNGIEIYTSSLVAYEYRQSIRLLIFQNSRNPKIGLTQEQGELLIERLRNDIKKGIIVIVDVDWDKAHSRLPRS